MSLGLQGRGIEDALLDLFSETDETLSIETGGRDVIRAAIHTLASVETGSVQLLAEEQTFGDVLTSFLVASTVADLLDDGRLTVRTTDESLNSIIVSGTAVTAILTAGSEALGVSTDDDSFVAAVHEQFATNWAEANTPVIRTPPLSRVRETLAHALGADVATTFDTVLSAHESAHESDHEEEQELDEVTIVVLVAAFHRELQYDLGRWAEDVGLASRTTISREKKRLEDAGLIDTEKVPVDLGRPRFRLVLADEQLQAANAEELTGVAQNVLTR